MWLKSTGDVYCDAEVDDDDDRRRFCDAYVMTTTIWSKSTGDGYWDAEVTGDVYCDDDVSVNLILMTTTGDVYYDDVDCDDNVVEVDR